MCSFTGFGYRVEWMPFSKTGVRKMAMKQFQSEDPKITCHLSRNALRNVETHAKPTQ